MTLSISYADWDLSQQPDLLISHLDHLGLIAVSGEQNRSFIHGQVTTDITSLEENQWRWGAHCDPKGKMLATFRTFGLDENLMMLMPKSSLAVDLPQLAKYAVFSKAELVDDSEQYLILGIAGEQAQAWADAHFAVSETSSIAQELTVIPGGVLIKDGPRFILIIEQDSAKPLLGSIGDKLYDATPWKALEIAAGYPNIGAQHSGQFVPQMANLQAVNGISFEKGCYMGQETVARMKYRGGNKRALYILSGTSKMQLTADSQLEIALEDGSFKKVGAIIEQVQTGEQLILSAVLPNDTQVSAKLRVQGDEQSQLEITPLPYSLAE